MLQMLGEGKKGKLQRKDDPLFRHIFSTPNLPHSLLLAFPASRNAFCSFLHFFISS